MADEPKALGTYSVLPETQTPASAEVPDLVKTVANAARTASSLYKSMLKAQGLEAAADTIEQKAAGMTDEEDKKRLAELEAQMPSLEKVQGFEEKLNYRRNALD